MSVAYPPFPAAPTSGNGNRAAGSALRRWPTDLRRYRPSTLGVFFMRLLPFRIGPDNRRARFAQAESQLPEQALTLSHSQADSIPAFDPGSQGFAVPQIAAQSQRSWHLPQGGVDLLPLFLAQPSRPPAPFALAQAGQPLFLKSPRPILHGARPIS